MGDRANIYIVDRKPAAEDDTETTGIYLYTHWNGYQWPEMLREALNRGTARNRWSDEPYLTRILVTHLFDDLGHGETGGGISTMRTDNEYPITVLDIPGQQVAWAAAGSEGDRTAWYGHIGFEDFCAQEAAAYPADLNQSW